MEFNTTLATQGGYADKLEKPFDTAALRKLVTKFYKETESHPLNGLLDFPAIPEFTEEPFMDDQYQNVQLQTKNAFDDELHFSAPLNRSNSKIHIETESHGDFEEVVLVQSSAERSQDQYKISSQIKNYLDDSPAALNKIEKHVHHEMNQQLSRQNNHQMSQPGSNRVDENLVREEVRALTEKICWQIIPDVAEKIIRAEIEKLLKNIEKSI